MTRAREAKPLHFAGRKSNGCARPSLVSTDRPRSDRTDALCRLFCINALNLLERGCKLCRFRERSVDDAHGLSLCLSPSLIFSSLRPSLAPRPFRSLFSLASARIYMYRGIPRDYGSTRYYLQRTYVTFRTAYYCDYRRIMRRPSRSTIYYWIAIIRIDHSIVRCAPMLLRTICCCGKCVMRVKFLYT